MYLALRNSRARSTNRTGPAAKNVRDVSRDRVLTDQELAAVILAARSMPPPYGRIVEFLALTGQRREEAAQLTWEEINEKARTWTIPGSRTKNKRAHIVHLSEPAWKVIQACSGEPYVFCTARGNRFQRFGKEKRAIDKLCGVTGAIGHSSAHRRQDPQPSSRHDFGGRGRVPETRLSS